MKRVAAVAAFAAFTLFATGSAFAQSAGSFAGNFNGGATYLVPLITCAVNSTTNTCPNSSTTSVLTSTVKVSSSPNKSLLLMGSLETALYTDTQTSSKNGNKQTSSADASIIVTPTVTDANGNTYSVYPSSVTYDARLQTLSATFNGTDCTANLTTGVVTCTNPETVELLLSTMSAHTFNFLVPGLPEGTYTINLSVAASTTGSTDSVDSGVNVQAGVRAGSLGVLTVQTQTPFDSLNFTE